jgi:uncharacterized protein YlbG (UPF0298 family)
MILDVVPTTGYARRGNLKMRKRVGLAVWVNNIRTVRHLKRFGNIHYVSKRFKYAILYVDADFIDEAIQIIKKFNFVTHVERSYRHEISLEFQSASNRKETDLDYQVGI